MKTRHPDPVSLIDAGPMAAKVGCTEDEVREAYREAIRAGFLEVVSVDDNTVTLRATLPNERQQR